MPLIVLSGQPSSGKSTIAAKLRDLLVAQGAVVHLVDEPYVFIKKNQVYKTGFDEKNGRAKLKSAVDRLISKKETTILDTLNNIKGYRYELWCIARAAATRYCMVHVDTDVDTCRQWNQQRQGDERYEDAVFDDLAGRFERPDSCNRWDSPLFVVRPGEVDEASVLDAVVAVVSESSSSSAAGGPQSSKVLKPSCATSNPALQETNTLHEIDQAAQQLIDKIMEAQTSSGSGAAGIVHFGEGVTSIRLDKPVALAELRRHKRAFLKLATKITFSRLQDSNTAQRMFSDYLREQLGGSLVF